MSDLMGLLLTGLLLVANAFFVGAEFALISARRTKIEPRAQGNPFARVTLYGMRHVSMMMAGAQLGITICSLALGSISEPAIAHLLEAPMDALGVPSGWQHPIALTIALSLVTYLHVVFGEMVPKNIALAGPDRMAIILTPVLVVISFLLYPVLWVLNGIANLALHLIRVTPKDEVTSTFTRDEVAELVEESHEGGLIELNDEKLLLGALQFTDRDVRGALLPLEEVTTLPESITPADAEAAAAIGYSRFPVTSRSGMLVGYLHVKDIISVDPAVRHDPIDPALIRTLPHVLASSSMRAVVQTMQATGSHLAAVYEDATDALPLGVVTLEDVLEELVGEIRDDSRRMSGRR